MSKSIKLKNYQLPLLVKILDVPLPGKDSRARSKFLEVVSKQTDANEKVRIELLRKHADKDKKGEPIIAKDNYEINEKNSTLFIKEFSDFQKEEFVIDVLPSNEESIRVVTKLILDTKVEFSIGEGAAYEDLCEVFEKAK